MAKAVTICLNAPYDLGVSLRVANAFSPHRSEDGMDVWRSAVWYGETSTVLEVRQVQDRPPLLQALLGAPSDPLWTRAMAERVVNAALDLRPFYQLVSVHPVFGPLCTRLRGLKPFRPPTLYEILVIAVIEQQISLAAANQIRNRLVARFGEPVGDLTCFPRPEPLASSALEDLVACGLSHRKAEYVRDMSQFVITGELDLDQLEHLSDDEVIRRITAIRGFGRWSADYLLVRGLGRPDAAPTDDLGVRTVVGLALGDGTRMTADQVEVAIRPFAPYRGLAVFYLLAAARLDMLKAG